MVSIAWLILETIIKMGKNQQNNIVEIQCIIANVEENICFHFLVMLIYGKTLNHGCAYDLQSFISY